MLQAPADCMRTRAMRLALLALAAFAVGVRGAVDDRADAFASGYSEKSHATPCTDTKPECAGWADAGECELNPGAHAAVPAHAHAAARECVRTQHDPRQN
jgi:hypothetical protein